MMKGMKKSNTIVIALGGSLIVPDGIDVEFLKKFRKLLFAEMNPPAGGDRKFVIVVGGGKTARMYQKAVLNSRDKDIIGIEATKLNAELLRIIFKNNVYIVGGTKPGWSTDYAAMEQAKKFGAKEVIIAGDIPFVYDKDPKKYKNAKPIFEISWAEYQKLIPKKWKPGLSSPVDPVAASLARKIGLTAKILKGTDLSNFKNAIDGKAFQGTLIHRYN